MTEAKYLLRFDDICPTMKWTVWNQVEQILDEYDIKPIIAVIPDNTDPSLVIEPSPEDYWDTIKRCKKKDGKLLYMGININMKIRTQAF